MADDNRLADELASLRIDRARRERGSDAGPRGSGGRKRSRGWLFVLLLLIGGLGVGGFYLFREGKGRIFPDEVEVGAIGLMSPAQADVTLVATGYIYARKKATVAPKTQGRLARLFVDETQLVKEGQVIAELDAADAQAQLAQVRADIAAARAKIENARTNFADAQVRFDREDALLKKGAGTQAAFDDAKSRLTIAKAQVTSAEADVRAIEARQQAAQVQLENTRVRAPFAATVIRKNAELGEVITPASPNGVFTIATLDDLEVQVDVSESQFSKVKSGTPTEILLDAFPDHRFRGQVSEIRQTVDRAKASVTVKVRFTDDSKGVLPDMAAKVSFLVKALDAEALKAAPKVTAPADAVVERNGTHVVFTIEDGYARQVGVVVGAQFGSQVEIVRGPSPGTRVVRHPSSELHDGLPIKEKSK